MHLHHLNYAEVSLQLGSLENGTCIVNNLKPVNYTIAQSITKFLLEVMARVVLKLSILTKNAWGLDKTPGPVIRHVRHSLVFHILRQAIPHDFKTPGLADLPIPAEYLLQSLPKTSAMLVTSSLPRVHYNKLFTTV